MNKTFKHLELGDYLVFTNEIVEMGGFIEEKGIDYIKLNRGQDEPKWVISQRFYEQKIDNFSEVVK